MEKLVFNKKNNSIQKVNLKKEKNSLLKNNSNSITKYLICPKCNLYIPSLPFFINPIEEGSIEILINCKCGNKDRMPLEDYYNFKIPVSNINICEECNSNKPDLNCLYCIDCSKWICEDCRKCFIDSEKNHNYSEYPVVFNELCDIHINHQNLFYCKNCNRDLCIKCTNYHQNNHKIINLIDYYNKIKESDFIKNIENNINIFNNKNEELKNKCLEDFEKIELEFENSLNEFDSDSKEMMIEREKFIEIYEKNKAINQQLNKFIHSLYDIFISAEHHPNYNIIHNLEVSSFINDNFPKIENKNKNNSYNYYINMYKKIYRFFIENHLLSIKSLILMKEEKIFLDKYNIKHLLKIDEKSIFVTTDSCFLIFNTETKNLSEMINGHNKEITRILKLKTGNIITGSLDGQIKIWNIENTFSLVNTLTFHEEEIIELLELSDKNLLSADKIGKISIWDINKYKQIQIILINLNILAISEISILEFFIITDKNFIVFENNIKTIKKTFNNKIISTLFVNSHLICGTDDNMIDVYQINPLQNIKSYEISNAIITIKKFNDKYFYGISCDYNLYFFKLSNYEQISCITIKTFNFYELLCMNDFFAYCGSNNGLIEWNLNIHNLIDDYVDNIVLI